MQNKECIKIHCFIIVSHIYLFFLVKRAHPSWLKKSQRVGLRGGYLAGHVPRCEWGREPVSGEQRLPTANRNQYKPGNKKKYSFKLSTSDCWGSRQVSLVNHCQGRHLPLIIWPDHIWDKKTPIPSKRNWKASLIYTFWRYCFAVAEEASHFPQNSAHHSCCVAFLFWRGSEKFPLHVCWHLSAQVSLPNWELSVMSSPWDPEKSFQLCQELFHFVPKEKGEKKSAKS